MMPESSLKYTRTPEERADEQLSWKRPDKAFFASGACHILAFAYKELNPTENLEIVFIKPVEKFGSIGTHVYIRKNNLAFDFNGWSTEKDLLRVNEDAYANAHPGWGYQLVVLNDDLETFCRQHQHRLPQDFAHDPWKRAKQYIKQLESN